ncbi:hypothetical protein Tco_0434627 [Tanacetum coccineum]
MEPEVQTETASSQVVHVVSPVAHSDHIVHENSSESVFTSSNSVSGRQVEVPAVEVDTSSTLQGRFLNKGHFKRYITYIGIAAAVATQMNGSSEKQKTRSVIFLVAISAVYAMESWAMSHKDDIHQAKWKVTIFGIAFNFTKLLSFYVLLSMLKPEWFTWCGFVIVSIIATAYKCSDELNTKFTWCYEKGVLVINYVMDKDLEPIRKDQASPASAPTRASV